MYLSVLCMYFTVYSSINSLPSVTALKFKDHLQMAVGTATGQVWI